MTAALKITPEQAQEEIARRARAKLALVRTTPEFRQWVDEDINAGMHDKQREADADPARYKAYCCSRRAGKTSLVARAIVKALQKAQRKQWVMFIAPTLEIGKDLIWAELVDLHDHYCLGWKLSEQRGFIETAAGAKFRIVGLDKLKQVEKLRGYDVVLFVTDETQTYEHLLPALLDAVSPALSGRRGVWLSAGTPGPALRGFWFDICHGKHGFVAKRWTVLDNSKNPRPGAEVIAEERERRQWPDHHPTLRREWYGEWVEDSNYLVCEFSSARNVVQAPPADYGLHWKHVVGLDFGYTDPCAWVVLAVDPHSRRSFVVHNEEHARLTIDEAVEVTKRIMLAYGTKQVVCDPGGGGQSFYETFNARYAKLFGVSIRSANKVDKLGSISLLNTELRELVDGVARLCIVGTAVNLVHQLGSLRWKDETRDTILEGALYPDHSFDALRYALMEAAPWAVRAKPEPKSDEQKAREERASRQRQKQSRKWWDRDGGSHGRAR